MSIWDVPGQFKSLALQDAPSQVTVLTFDRDGRMLAVADDQGMIQIRNTSNGKIAATLKGHPMRIHGLAFTPDGTRLASIARDGTVKIWDTRAGDEVLSLRGHATFDTAIAFSPNGETCIAGGWDGFLRAWSVEDSQKLDGEVTEERRRAWHEREAGAASKARRWFASARHYDELIKMHPERWTYRAGRGQVHAEEGQWNEAAAQFDLALADAGCSSGIYGERARLFLRAGAVTGYDRLCQKMLEVFGERGNEASTNSMIWTCSLGTIPPVSAERLVGMAERGLGRALPQRRRFVLNTLGATLYRAGRFDEALQRLDESVSAHGGGGAYEDWLLLAMVHHYLGHHDEAQRWLDRASAELEQLVTGSTQSGTDGLSWWERFDLEWLLAEAKTVLGPRR